MLSSVRPGRRRDGLPVYSYRPDPGLPAVAVHRFGREVPADLPSHSHVHDFPILAYFERGGVALERGRELRIEPGDLFVIAPGDLMDVGGAAGLRHVRGSAVFFTPDVLGADRPEPLLSWRAHPLLFPFVRGSFARSGAAQGGTGGGMLRLRVPPAERSAWADGIDAIERELAQRRDGYRQATLAHLVLLLVGVARLADDVVGDLRVNDEKLLADVFAVIERRYPEQLSLRDVAASVSLTPGHLTTSVRRKTGRTVQDWITERRMTEARRLLVETSLSVAEVGSRVGYRDSGYFARAFRRAHGVPPRQWRGALG